MRKIIILTLLLVGLACGVVGYGPAISLVPEQLVYIRELSSGLQEDVEYVRNTAQQDLSVSFSHDDFFYSETIHVSITANNPDATIFLTLDGETPSPTSEVYAKPIELVATDKVRCFVLKAIAVYEDEESPVLTHSYFVGTTVEDRFPGYVFSISTDDRYFNGHEQGLLVMGKTYDDFMAENPDTEVRDRLRPANFRFRGMAWEHPVFIETFTSDGERVISQNAGIRIHGGITRWYPQKSMRLIARRMYEPGVGSFYYDFFEDETSSCGFDSPITSYNTLILRNDGNDFNQARLRTPLASWIAREAGFSTVSPYAAAAIFLNGEYYGYANLNVRINSHFLQDLYNAPDRDFTIVSGGIIRVRSEEDEDIVEEFSRLIELAWEGFPDDTIEILKSSFDIDNLLFYYALQVYLANHDWPRNNVRIWRYNGLQDEENPIKELDGRWRYEFFDLDQTMHFADNSAASTESIHRAYYQFSPLLRALVQRPEYAEQFVNYLCDMTFDHFSSFNVERVIQEIDELSFREIEESAKLYGQDVQSLLRSRARITTFIEERPAYIIDEIRRLFGYTDFYRIISDGSVKINTMNSNNGLYFVENRVPVMPVLPRNHVVDHWLVNGEIRHGESLVLSVQDADENGVVNVRLITREELPPLRFLETYDTGDIYGFIMYNPTTSVQNPRDLYLSDNLRNLKKWQFPNINIPPGGKWELVGRDSLIVDSLLKIGLNFNPRRGEVIYLSNEDGDILDYIGVR